MSLRGEGSVFTATDTHYGHIDDATLASLEGGWHQLLTEGLMPSAESLV